jgi:hypothetical protein
MDVLELNPVIRISCMGDPCPSPIEMWMVLKNFDQKLVHSYHHYLKGTSPAQFHAVPQQKNHFLINLRKNS